MKQLESRAQRNIRNVMAAIKEEQKQKIVKYLDQPKEEQELAKPRYAHSQFPQHKFYEGNDDSNLIDFCIENMNLRINKVGTLVEPMIPTEEIPPTPVIRKAKTNKQPVFITEVPIVKTLPKQTEIPFSIKRSTQQQMMNKEILRRLGLLSVQAKRELEIEKLSNRALKVARLKDSPVLNRKQLEIISKQMKDAEKSAQEQSIQRCTTTASAASRKAYAYQDDNILEILSERPQLVYSVQSIMNRPTTQKMKSRIHNFFKTVTLTHLDNQNFISKDFIGLQFQVKYIKESLQSCKKKLLDYNDEIEIALTEDIKGQVIEYKNIIKNNNNK